MRAVVHETYGPPSVLHIAEIPAPEPGENEILVRVHASTVNRSDCGFRAADPFIVRFFSGLWRPRRPVTGTEFSGDVVAVGKGVTQFKPGDAVFGRAQDETMGAHAAYLCIGQNEAVGLKPGNLTYIEAAAVCDGAMLADTYLKLVDFRRQSRILVYGASGSIGSAAVQLAKARDAHVTAVCGTDALDVVTALGADRVVDYEREDFTAIGETFDTVFDAVGKTSLGECRALLRAGGTFFATDLGPHWENPVLAIKTALFGGRIKVHFPIPHYRKDDVLRYKALVEAGKFHPVIDRVYPLEEIVAANEYVETGRKIGNVVIVVVPPAEGWAAGVSPTSR